MSSLSASDIKINPSHDPKALGKILHAKGRLQIAHFFEETTAEKLSALIESNRIWNMAYNEGEQAIELGADYLVRMSPLDQKNLWATIMGGARKGFQYLFNQYHISDAIKRGENTGHPLHFMEDFVNSPAFMAFMKDLTASDEIVRSDCYVTEYRPNHFLLGHDDKYDAHNRVAAYVISMTREWKDDWGGHLVFYDDEGNIEEGFIPKFNALNIFFVPKRHAVTFIPPFVPKSRYSFLGWLRKD